MALPPNGWRGTMSHYRLYFMNPRSGHIESFVALEAPDDQRAMALARAHVGDHPLELWCAGRKAGRLDALDIVPPSRQQKTAGLPSEREFAAAQY